VCKTQARFSLRNNVYQRLGVSSPLEPVCEELGHNLVRRWAQVAPVVIFGYEAQCQTEGCHETIFLPAPRNPRAFEIQPYMPMGTWPLRFSCPTCTHGSTLGRADFYGQVKAEVERKRTPSALWFLIVRCSKDPCGIPLRLHTIAPCDSTLDAVARTILVAIREFRCEANHPLRADGTHQVELVRQPTIAI